MIPFPYCRITDKNNNEGIDLNDFNGYLMTSPSGFGIYRTSEYITIGNQRIAIDNKPTFRKITLNIDIFGKRLEVEEKYSKLRDFISKHINNGFRLYYIKNNETRYINCDINIVDKKIREKSHLPVGLEITPKSLWLIDVSKSSVTQTTTESNLFRFKENNLDGETYYSAIFENQENLIDEFGREIYGIKFKISATNEATLSNVGAETSPLVIRIYGDCVNPVVKLYKYGNPKLYQYVKFDNLVVPKGFYLEINANADNNYIQLVNSNTGDRIDRESYVDIESNVYLNLPVGEYLIQVTDDTQSNNCYCDIFYQNQYYGG